MDGVVPQPHDFGAGSESDVVMEAPPLVRFDERRMHVRAYNYWASLLGDRALPNIEDLNPEDIEDFGSHSVLLDLTGGIDDPAVAFLGSALTRECGGRRIERISDVPARTVLSRLTDHVLQIVANQAPIGFEAEFTNAAGAEILYRGILMPFSTDDDSIDFIYGVINWKEVAAAEMTRDIQREIGDIFAGQRPDSPLPVWGDEAFTLLTVDEADDEDEDAADTAAPMWRGAPEGVLAQSLADARDAAAVALASESRSRQALYRAIGLGHSFALAARARPEDYAALLADAGLAEQARNPQAALVRLIFGSDYDKTRLAEFALVIGHALDTGVASGALAEQLAAQPGGLKAQVAMARAAKRGTTAPADPLAEARRRLAQATPVDIAEVAVDDAGLAVLVVRRLPDGTLAPLGALAGDDRRAQAVLRAVAADAA